MKEKIVDTRTLSCPKPLIMTKKALSETEELVTVIVDNDISKENIETFLRDNNFNYKTIKEENVYKISIAGRLNSTIQKEQKRNSNIIAISSDSMGRGDDELGKLLMQGFINSIKDVNVLPSVIVFYNTGVKLVADNSVVIDSICELKELGTKIVVCGACVDYFDLKEKIKFAEITNMYSILEMFLSADKVIMP